jgi:hypothetical protein
MFSSQIIEHRRGPRLPVYRGEPDVRLRLDTGKLLVVPALYWREFLQRKDATGKALPLR